MKFLNFVIEVFLLFFLFQIIALGQENIPDSITIERDTVLLKGKFYESKEEGFLPTLVLLPGFPGDENDVIGLGPRLSQFGVNVMMFNYSGTHKSQGRWGFKSVQADITAALKFLHNSININKFGIDTTNIILGGHSYGGGMAMSFAIEHPEIDKVISIAGNDWGEHFEDYVRDANLKTAIDGMVDWAVSSGTVRPEKGELPKELLANGTDGLDSSLYLKRNAEILAQKNVLLICAWNDTGVFIEKYVLPLYRALQKENAKHVRIIAYQDDHNFNNSRDEMANSIKDWIKQLRNGEN